MTESSDDKHAAGRPLPEIKEAIVNAIAELVPPTKATILEIGTFFSNLNRIFSPKIVQGLVKELEERSK